MGGSAFDLVDGTVGAYEETALGDVRLLRRGNERGRLWPFGSDWTSWPLGVAA